MSTQINLHSVASKTTPAAQTTKCATCQHLYSYLTDPDFCDRLNPVTVRIAIGGGHHRQIVTACSGYQPTAEGGQDG